MAATSASVSQSHNATAAIPPGSIVSLSQTNRNTIELSDAQKNARVIGVAVKDSGSLVAVDSDNYTT